MFVVVVVVCCVLWWKSIAASPLFKHGGGTRLVLLFCLMFFLALELTIMPQTALITRGGGARRERRWQDRPLAASPRGYWYSVFCILVSVSLC